MAFRARTDADTHADHWKCMTRPLSAGAAVIVLRGRWHRIELVEPSDVMAVIVLRGTRLEKRTNP